MKKPVWNTPCGVFTSLKHVIEVIYDQQTSVRAQWEACKHNLNDAQRRFIFNRIRASWEHDPMPVFWEDPIASIHAPTPFGAFVVLKLETMNMETGHVDLVDFWFIVPSSGEADGMVLIPFDQSGVRVHLIREFRARALTAHDVANPCDGMFWSFVGGRIDVDKNGSSETPETAALRELKEEAGGTAENVRTIGIFNSHPAWVHFQDHVMVAKNVRTNMDAQQLMDQEFVENERWVSRKEFNQMICAGERFAANCLAAIRMYEAMVPETSPWFATTARANV